MAGKNILKNVAKKFNYKICEDCNLSGFGKNVRSVACNHFNETKCYFNQDLQVYFPKPLNIQEINDIMLFLEQNGVVLNMREVI